MTGGRLRTLSEAQVRRVLASGGVLVETGGDWLAHRSRDARMRAAGRVTPLIVSRLQSDGVILADPTRPGRFLGGPSAAPPPLPAVPSPLRLLRPGRASAPASLYAGIVGAAAADLGEMTRLKAAAQRFRADISLAAASSRKVGRIAGRVAGADPDAALCRLAALEGVIGRSLFRQLESLLIDAASPAVFAREAGLRWQDASAQALEALRTLARAYDLSVRLA